VVTNARAFYTPRAATGAAGTRLSLRPLSFKGEWFMDNSDVSRREKADVYLVVIAREAKQSIKPKVRMDCFVASLLAMTELAAC
jgi:hypothetical protein